MSEVIPNSNKYYPNKFGRFFLVSLRETVTEDGYMKLLERAGVAQYAKRLPEDNWAREFDFAIVARLNQGLFELFGPRGGRRLALRTGSGFFRSGLGEVGDLAGITDLAHRALPIQVKLQQGLMAVARTFSQTSDQTTWLEEQEMQLLYFVDPCPVCWQQSSASPLCTITTGFLQEVLSWLSDGQNYRVQQTACKAMGGENCLFRIDRDAIK